MTIPIILITDESRENLLKQTLSTLHSETHYPYQLLTGFDNSGVPNFVKSKTKLMNKVSFDWKLAVWIDDDLHFKATWLEKMVEIMENNLDISLLGGSYWPMHKVLEERKNVEIMEMMSGGCMMIRRNVWEEYKPLAVETLWDKELVERVREDGGLVGRLKDRELVVHCGIKNVNGRGRSKKNEKIIKDLADKVGAIAE